MATSCAVRQFRRSELADRGHGREEEEDLEKNISEYSVLQFKFEGSVRPQLKLTLEMRFPRTENRVFSPRKMRFKARFELPPNKPLKLKL